MLPHMLKMEWKPQTRTAVTWVLKHSGGVLLWCLQTAPPSRIGPGLLLIRDPTKIGTQAPQLQSQVTTMGPWLLATRSFCKRRPI